MSHISQQICCLAVIFGKYCNLLKSILYYFLAYWCLMLFFMATSKLDLPSRKLFVSDIQCSRKAPNQSKISGLNVWKFTSPNVSLVFSIVWIQGIVIEVWLQVTYNNFSKFVFHFMQIHFVK